MGSVLPRAGPTTSHAASITSSSSQQDMGSQGGIPRADSRTVILEDIEVRSSVFHRRAGADFAPRHISYL